MDCDVPEVSVAHCVKRNGRISTRKNRAMVRDSFQRDLPRMMKAAWPPLPNTSEETSDVSATEEETETEGEVRLSTILDNSLLMFMMCLQCSLKK